MILAKVLGPMVATFEVEVYRDKKVLWVQPVDLDGSEKGRAFLTLDAVGAGAGETVLVVQEGSSAMQVFGLKEAPVSSAIVGIVDALELYQPERRTIRLEGSRGGT